MRQHGHFLCVPNLAFQTRIFATLGYDPVGDTPEQYAKAIRDDLIVFEKVITRAGLRVK